MCNSDPNNLSFQGKSPIQLAALMKKYLRDLPEPLLTLRLYRVFIATQSIFLIVIFRTRANFKRFRGVKSFNLPSSQAKFGGFASDCMVL